jgi:hypothetical protein
MILCELSSLHTTAGGVPSGGERRQRIYPPLRILLRAQLPRISRNPPHWVHPLLCTVVNCLPIILFRSNIFSFQIFSTLQSAFSRANCCSAVFFGRCGRRVFSEQVFLPQFSGLNYLSRFSFRFRF